METVEVVIRLPKEQYNNILNKGQVIALSGYEKMIGKGTVLPKGHGRLVDAEKIAREVNRAWTLWEKKGEDCYLFADVLTPMLISQPTVIEADKEEEHDSKD